MKIQYRICGEEIEVARCLGGGSKVEIQEVIEGKKVTRIAPYAFSNHNEEKLEDCLVYETEDTIFSSKEPLAGSSLEEVILPSTVNFIGNYVLYGCEDLKKIEFSDELTNVGSGAFTGCSRLERITVHCKKGRKTCVKQILEDLWQCMEVVFEYEEGESRVVFPEYYEEAVENTPARILMTHYHGSGTNYRQCFYTGQMNYHNYDELFSMACVMERLEVLIQLIFDRLSTPVDLSEKFEKEYLAYIKENSKKILTYLVKKEKTDWIYLLSKKKFWDEEKLDFAMELAQSQEQLSMVSFLMDEKHKLFPKKKKKFEL